ncbi:MAG: YggT family protein, partial [Methylobacterium sp.]|nr:YggT family protein [Methylobacterium sp.]
MFTGAAEFLLNTLLGLFTLALLLRFYLQLTAAPFHNPFCQAVVALTNFAVRPLRRLLPAWGWLDTASLLLAFVAQLALHLATLWLRDFPLLVADAPVFPALLGLAGISLVKLSIYIFMYGVLLQAILSWVNPHTPLAPVLDSLTRPLMRPLRRRIPLAGGIDLTPLVVFIAAELLL